MKHTDKRTRKIEVLLNDREMNLLEMLIKHYNQVFPHPMNLSDTVRFCLIQEGTAMMLRLEGKKNG